MVPYLLDLHLKDDLLSTHPGPGPRVVPGPVVHRRPLLVKSPSSRKNDGVGEGQSEDRDWD